MTIDRPITIALILLTILLLVFFLVVPQYHTFVKLQNNLAEKRAEEKAQREYYVEIAKTHNDLYEHKDDIKKIDDALPKDPALAKLLYYIQDTAKKNGIMVKDLFLSKSSLANQREGVTYNIKEIVFSTNVLGSYVSLGNFLSALENSARIFEVTTISFGSGSSSKSGVISQNFSLQIKTYSY